MGVTPEGKVKKLVKTTIAKYEGVYVFMPVQTGFGTKTLDFLLCANGSFVAIETKAPGKKPTPLQHLTIGEILGAGGKTIVLDGAWDDEATLMETLDACGCKRKV